MPEIAEIKYLLDPYGSWSKAEGVPIVEALSVDLLSVATKPWPRYGVDGALVHLNGRGDFCSLFLLDIVAGAATHPQRHVFEEIILVLDGAGATEIDSGGGPTTLNWKAGALFAIPLNARYSHRNTGPTRARLASVTSLQVMMNLFHNSDFIFANDARFPARTPAAGARVDVAPGRHMLETGFVADLAALDLKPGWKARAAAEGVANLNLIMADGSMHAHVTEIPAGIYEKANRWGTDFHFFPLSGQGYTLLWKKGDTAFDRVDWRLGTAFAPQRGMFYQHFNTGRIPARYLAVTMGSMRYPFVEENLRVFAGDMDTAIADGGGQVEYTDENPRWRADWLAELGRNGGASRMG